MGKLHTLSASNDEYLAVKIETKWGFVESGFVKTCDDLNIGK